MIRIYEYPFCRSVCYSNGMERFLRSQSFKSQSGTTLVELMVGTAIAAMVLYSATYTLQTLSEHKSRLEMRASIESIRVNFLETVLDDLALEQIFDDPANTSLACLKNNTSCPAVETPLRFKDRNGNVLYDPANAFSSAGFTREGQPCNTFNSGNPSCPFRYEFTWRAICATCSTKLYEVTASLKYRPGTSSGAPMNEQSMSFKVVRNLDSVNNQTPYNLYVGASHACAVMLNGRAKCFGLNQNAELGLGDMVDRRSSSQMGNALPYIDVGSKTVTSLLPFPNGTCSLLSDNTVRCWGGSQYYLENGWYGASPATMGDNLGAFVGVWAGKTPKKLSDHAAHMGCAVMTDGTSTCWAPNADASREVFYGMPGGGNPATGALINTRVLRAQFTSPIVDVSSGGFQICYLLEDVGPSVGTLKSNVICWGAQYANTNYGQIGDGGPGDGKNSSNPAEVVFTTDPDDPELKVPSTYYQTTYNNMMDDTRVKYVNLNGERARQISSGDLHVCAVLAVDDSVWCWGRNIFGELGTGPHPPGPKTWRVRTPTKVNLPGPVDFVTAAETSTCALLKNGAVYCWGALNGGMAAPVGPTLKNFGGKKVTKLASAVVDNFCAITEDYQTYCWSDFDPGKVAFAYHEDHLAWAWDQSNDSKRDLWGTFRIDADVYSLVKWFD